MLTRGVLPGFGDASPHTSRAAGHSCAVWVAVSSWRFPPCRHIDSAQCTVAFALVCAVQVAMVHGDEQVVALFFRNRPVRGGGS